VFVISRRLWGERPALVAAGLAAVFPPLVLLNVSLLSEVAFIPLMLASLLAVLEFRKRGGLRWLAVAGFLCGLAVLTRSNGLLLVLPLALGAWTLRPRFSRAALAGPAVLVLVTLVTLAPWVIRNTLEFDRFIGVGTQAGFALAATYNAESRARAEHPGQPFVPFQLRTFSDLFRRHDLDEAELTGRLNDRAVDYIKSHPGYVLETMAWNVPRVLDIVRHDSFERLFPAQEVQARGIGEVTSAPVYLGSLYVVLVLALAGIAAQAGLLPSRRAPLFVWGLPLVVVLPGLAIYGLARYRAPVDPFLVMLAAVGVYALIERFRGDVTEPSPPRTELRTPSRA
jgi:4-amino-4-deoxy-L-arabinose transferase-like glycosyltransferase